MARHFLTLFVLIVATLAATSWCEDKLLAAYGGSATEPLNVEVFKRSDITGDATLHQLADGKVVRMLASGNEVWTLKQLDAGQVLVIKTRPQSSTGGPIEWLLTFAFYTAIALALMAWLWPLTRDLRRLEFAVARFGDRHWTFEANIRPHSQIYRLADCFQRMARRIDELIASHKDMSNALAHEIRTPLARMQFELEMARQAGAREEAQQWMESIEGDIAAVNDLVTTTLNYAILERAELTINLTDHDLRLLLPAIVESVTHDVGRDIQVQVQVHGDVSRVNCDIQLLERLIRNLVSNSMRYAKQQVQVSFGSEDHAWALTVDDDGPGIGVNDRQRVFDAFVQLDQSPATKTGFGLGLAIVRRIIEWHKGIVAAQASPLGGARFQVKWPVSQTSTRAYPSVSSVP